MTTGDKSATCVVKRYWIVTKTVDGILVTVLVTRLCPNGAFPWLSDVREKETKIPQNLDFAGFVFIWLHFVFEPLRRERDSNPRYSCPYTAIRVRPDRPLRHLSTFLERANITIFLIPTYFFAKNIALLRFFRQQPILQPAESCLYLR